MKEHLPVYGVGPVYAIGISLSTLAAAVLQNRGILPVAGIPRAEGWLWLPAAVLCLGAAWLWFSAVLHKRIGTAILENHLVTDGVYAWVRNPIYTALMFLSWAVLLVQNNLYLWLLCLGHWGFLTVLMMLTEERWLQETYGEEYTAYCRRVNRCIPMPPYFRR